MINELKGIGASKGIAIAKVFLLKEEKLVINEDKITDTKAELALLETSIEKSKKDINQLKEIALEKLGPDKAEIFVAHGQILTDPAMKTEIVNLINTKNINVAKAVFDVFEKYAIMFSQMDDEYFKERSADVRDVCNRLIHHIQGLDIIDLATINEEVVIVAEDLTPSQTAQLNPKFVKGFACDMGGRTSHAAIMARSLEIPAVLGLKNITKKVKHKDDVIIDGISGEIIINPNKNLKTSWAKKQKDFYEKQIKLREFKNKPTISKDGYDKFVLEANIGSPNDVENALENGAEGIGLFRSEFLYMDNDNFPTENEQYDAYSKVIKAMDNKMVVIRTLDIGGDKKLSYFKFPEEMNPFLGFRAIRFCLEREDIFRTQLRALLRASVHGKLAIMFPMIATIEEFLQAKKILMEEKANLIAKNIKVSDDIQVGMMIEIPSAAIMAKQFAKHADFFSIGTNDLIQYTFAADRMNEHVAYLYQPYNPAILNLIQNVVESAHSEGKWVGMCGEMAGEELAIPLLMGMKLDYFSMSATSVLEARSLISNIDTKEAEKLVKTALTCATSDEVVNHVKELINKIKK